jgi:hypothetical protein
MLKKENLLQLSKVICFSVVFAIIIYFANFFIFTFTRLNISLKDLLFLEGLASIVFGIFLLISENPKRQESPLGAKQRLLYGGDITVGSEIRFSQLALFLILTGAILVLLYAVSY